MEIVTVVSFSHEYVVITMVSFSHDFEEVFSHYIFMNQHIINVRQLFSAGQLAYYMIIYW